MGVMEKYKTMKKFIRFSPVHPSPGSFGSGFFSNYRVVLDQLMQNDDVMDGIPYIDWGDTAWVEGYNPFNNEPLIKNENPFDFWFDQLKPGKEDIVSNPLKNGFQVIINHSLDYFYDPTSLSTQKNIDKKYIKVKPYILNKVDKIYQNEFDGHIVLGVIARGCEFSHWHPQFGNHTIYDYINEIQKILDNNKQITKIFIVSEDSNYVELLHKTFSNSYFMKDVFRRTNETQEYMNKFWLWPNIDTKRKDQNKLLGEETIIQTKLLGMCDYLLGKQTGGFAGAILWSENIKQIYKI